jgi:23S rRNA pseudouridine1911/1915/1917 synthase
MGNFKNIFEHFSITVDPKQELLRIDKFLFNRLPNVTRNRIQKAIIDGYIFVNAFKTKSNYKVKPGDEVKVMLPGEPRLSEILPEYIPLNIIFEDDDILILNKPSGIVVHPACGNWNGTLINGVLHYFNNSKSYKKPDRYGLVHRLDKDTSGIIAIAKNNDSLHGLAKQFHSRTIKRTYQAIVWGTPEHDFGTIDINLGRSEKDRRIVRTFTEKDCGKRAITHYRVLEKLEYVSLIECSLETGRTHQIRAHMKHIGHTIFGDVTYGGNSMIKGQKTSKYASFLQNCFEILPRQALHAKTLEFIHPITNVNVFFECNLPLDFISVLNKWKKY